jgi:hypothetical protein
MGQGGFVFTDMGGAADTVRSVAVQPDGKIVAMGDNGADFAVARYTSSGELDTSFGGGDGKVTVDSDADPGSPEVDTAGGGFLAADGDIVLGGKTDPDGGGANDADSMLIRLQGDPPASTTPSATGPTGQRAAALKKCKKKRKKLGWSKKRFKKCKKKALKLPV